MKHRERRHLRVAQVGFQIRLAHTRAQVRFVVRASEDVLALLAEDDRGAGVLARRQYSTGGDVGVLQHLERDEAVVPRGFRIVDDVAELLEVARSEEVRDVAHGFEREPLERRRLHDEDLAAVDPRDLQLLAGELAVRSVVGTELEDLLEIRAVHFSAAKVVDVSGEGRKG